MRRFLDSFPPKIFPAALILCLRKQFLSTRLFSHFQPFSAFHFCANLCKISEKLETHARCSFPQVLTPCKWFGMQTIANLVDLGNRRLKIELLDPQIWSSKFTLPRGCGACHLDYLATVACASVGCSLFSTCSCHKHFCVDVTCKNQLSDDKLFHYACCDY